MTVGTFLRRWFVKKDRFAIDHLRFLVTFITKNMRVTSGEREVRARVVVER